MGNLIWRAARSTARSLMCPPPRIGDGGAAAGSAAAWGNVVVVCRTDERSHRARARGKCGCAVGRRSNRIGQGRAGRGVRRVAGCAVGLGERAGVGRRVGIVPAVAVVLTLTRALHSLRRRRATAAPAGAGAREGGAVRVAGRGPGRSGQRHRTTPYAETGRSPVSYAMSYSAD